MTEIELEKSLVFIANECRIYRSMYQREYDKNVKLIQKLAELGGEVD